MSEVGAGINEVPSRLPVDVPKAETPPETSKEVSARQGAINALNKGIDLIKGNKDAVDKTAAKTVLIQEEGEKLNSDGIKAFFSATAAIGEIDPIKAKEIAEIEVEASKNLKIKIMGRDVPLSLDQWRVELMGLNNALKAVEIPPDGTPADPQKAEMIKQEIAELQDGDFAYEFPEEVKEKSSEDITVEKTIKDHLARVKNIIDQRKKSKIEVTENEERQLMLLGVADRANGPVGPRIKYEALQMLKGLGYGDLDEQIEYLQGQLPQADAVLSEFLKSKGYDEAKIKETLNKGGLEALTAEGKMEDWDGFEELVFGKELEDGELENILDPNRKKKKRDLYLTILAILVSGVTPLGGLIKTPQQ